jgi:hypothetical protein
MELITLEEDKDLLKDIREKTKEDNKLQDIICKLWAKEKYDPHIALGLCQERDGLLTYEGLIWIPTNDKLHLKLMHGHHDAPITGHPGRARTLELLVWRYY